MRGEDWKLLASGELPSGSPPHARGGPGGTLRAGRPLRITPACAGRTIRAEPVAAASADHPRMRGEDVMHPADWEAIDGSPPHARGGREMDGRSGTAVRITPACAGRTAQVERL